MIDGKRATGRDPLLPNAGIVARREYRDRVRSPLFVASTFLLMALALGVALAPIAIRYLDRQTVTRIAVVADDAELGARTMAVTDSILNVPPNGVDPANVGEVVPSGDRGRACEQANAGLAARELGGVMIVTRLPSGQLDITFRTDGPGGRRAEPVGRVRGRRGGNPRLDRDVAARLRTRHVQDAHVPRRLDERAHRRRQADRPAGGRESSVPRGRLRGAPLPERHHLRDVGRDRRRRREEQPGHGAHDQRGVAAPVADRQGGRHRCAPASRSTSRSPSRPWSSSPSRIGSPRPCSGPAGAAGAPIVGLTPGLLLGYGALLPAGVHAVRAHLRRDGVIRQSPGRSPDCCRCR